MIHWGSTDRALAPVGGNLLGAFQLSLRVADGARWGFSSYRGPSLPANIQAWQRVAARKVTNDLPQVGWPRSPIFPRSREFWHENRSGTMKRQGQSSLSILMTLL